MAKTSTSKAAKGQSEPQVQSDKEQKKQAKREAKLKLKIEFMQKNIQRAERKANKANAHVDTLRAQLHELNEQLRHDHTSSNHQEGAHDTTEVEQASQTDLVSETTDAEIEFHDAPQSQQDEAITGKEHTSIADTAPALGNEPSEDKEAIEELHLASLPPAEGRNDINGNTTSSPADTTTEPTQEVAEQIPSSEQHKTSPVSDANAEIEFHDAPQSQQDEATTGEEPPSVTNTGPALVEEPSEDKEAIEELHLASLPPVEGRNDINSNTTASPAATTTEPTQEVAEQTPSPEQHATSPVSNTKEGRKVGRQRTRSRKAQTHTEEA